MASRLFKRIAAEPETPEAEVNDVSVTSEVMEYVRRHREEVYTSDKEIPEVFPDVRPIEDSVQGEVDPGSFLLPMSLTGSQLNKDSAVVSNYRVFMKRYGSSEGVFPIVGDKGSFAIAIRISSLTAEMLDDLMVLEGTPTLDEDEEGQVQHEAIDEAWGDWAHYDFIRALESQFPDQGELIDKLDEDRARELFDRVRQSIGADWVEDSNSVFIDVDRVAEGVTLHDLKA